jgi:hypothetical protein
MEVRNFIYVDTENVGCSFLDYVDKFEEHTEFKILNGGKLSEEYISQYFDTARATFELVPVSVGTKNAMDFVLVECLTYTALQNTIYSRHIIPSRDNGYMPAIEHLRSKGYDVTASKSIESAFDRLNHGLPKLIKAIADCGYKLNVDIKNNAVDVEKKIS